MSEPFLHIRSGALSAAINPLGAELSSLRDSAGRELMTDADPAFWSGRAPLLFPTVGAVRDGQYRIGDKRYPMPQHGFARHQHFGVVEQEENRAVFRLTDSEATRAIYPFAFALDAAFTLDDATLAMDITVTNTGGAEMPASFGFHPAFAWPLPYGEDRAAHRMIFEKQEPAKLSSIQNALIGPADKPTPMVNRTIPLADDLFARDAMVWETLESDSLTYGAPEGPQLRFDFPGAPMLGIWTKPGARFVCVEPWWGIADPVGFDGAIWDKPGMMRFAPGESRTFTMKVTLED